MGWWDLSEGERTAFTFMAIPFGLVSMMLGSRLAAISHVGEVGSMLVIIMTLCIGLSISTAFWHLSRPIFRPRVVPQDDPAKDGLGGGEPEEDGPIAERSP